MSTSKFSLIWRSTLVRRVIIVMGLTLLLLLPFKHLLAQGYGISLKEFKATTLTGLPEVYLHWETFLEFNVSGFYVVRKLTDTGIYIRVSSFITAVGNTENGAIYDFFDDTTELSQTYYYHLEVHDDKISSTYTDSISVTAGIPITPSLRVYLPLLIRTD